MPSIDRPSAGSPSATGLSVSKPSDSQVVLRLSTLGVPKRASNSLVGESVKRAPTFKLTEVTMRDSSRKRESVLNIISNLK